MNKWQKIAIVVSGLLVLSCLALAGIGVWWFTNAGGSNALAAMTGQTPTPIITLEPTPTPVPSTGANPNPPAVGKTPKGGANLGAVGGMFGTVSSVSSASLTVLAVNGQSRTLNVGTLTRVIVAGTPNATLSNIQPGDKVLVIGLKRNDQSLQPRAIIAAPGEYTSANVAAGQIASVSGEQFTLDKRDGTALTVSVGTSTEVFGKGLRVVSSTTLTAGMAVVVIGVPGSDGTLTAQVVIGLANAGGKLPGFKGSKNSSPTPTPQ